MRAGSEQGGLEEGPSARTAAPVPIPLAASQAASSTFSFSMTSCSEALLEPSLIDMKHSFFATRFVRTQPHTTTRFPSAASLAFSSVATATRSENRSPRSSPLAGAAAAVAASTAGVTAPPAAAPPAAAHEKGVWPTLSLIHI